MKKLNLILILVAALTVSFAGFNRENKEYSSVAVVDVRSTGATGNGVTDDTGAIQTAIDQVAGTGGTVYVPDGTYMINALTALNLKSNMTFSMAVGAILRAIPNSSSGVTNIIRIGVVTNVIVTGGTVQGERAGHIGSTGEWGMGIGINGATNVIVSNLTARDCWGDGFYIGAAAVNITLDNVIADNNRRQGLSIVSANGVVVKNSIFKNTNGTAPQTGIDIESNAGTVVNNVQILNNEFTGNTSAGITVNMNNGLITNTVIDGNNSHDNLSTGINVTAKAAGVVISNNISRDNIGNGIAVWTNVSGNSILNNIVYGNTVHGIVIANNSNNNTITGNVATNNNHRGIILYNASGSSFTGTTGNTVTGNTATGNPDGDISDIVTPAGSNTVSGNILASNSWTGGTSTDWNTASNWSLSAVPAASTSVSIPSGTARSPVVNQASGSPAVCAILSIASGAILTIAPAKALTVSGLLTNNATSAGLVIQSNATGTGSLIAGSVSGPGTAQRWMTAGKWQMVSSPVPGQTVAAFLTANTNIPTYLGSRGMMDYNPASNSWNPFFTTGTGNGSLTAGKGFSMRVGASNAAVTFTGTLQAGSTPVTGLSPDSWNCIGNPYTSAMGINSNSTSTAKFLQVNAVDAANIDPLYGAVYVWDQPDASNGQPGNYTAVSNASAAFEVQQGQAFFVKMNTAATTIHFTSAMQIHNGALALKSAKIAWPTIKLAASVGVQSSQTAIAFNSAMTNGLDPTYDAGLFRGGSDLIVYSRLVEDNGIPFAIQALPSYSSVIIPVGVDFKTGGEVVFSAQLLNLPTECKVILEDKITKIFTDLSRDIYTVSLQANSVITDRFQIHTSYLTTGINPVSAGNLSAYTIRNVQINVNGEVSKNAMATLYDIQGRVVQVTNLDGGNSNIIRTPNLKTGIYLLFVKDNQKVQRFKLAVNE